MKSLTVHFCGVGVAPTTAPTGTQGTFVQVRTYASLRFNNGWVEPSALSAPAFGVVTSARMMVGAKPRTHETSAVPHCAYAWEKLNVGACAADGTFRSTSAFARCSGAPKRLALVGGKKPLGAATAEAFGAWLVAVPPAGRPAAAQPATASNTPTTTATEDSNRGRLATVTP